jgi:hypothetical protein
MCIYGTFKNDLGFYCFQRKEITKSKENTSNSKHPPPKNPRDIQIFNGMAQFYKSFFKNFVAIMAPKMTRVTDFFLDKRMSKALKIDQTKVY